MWQEKEAAKKAAADKEVPSKGQQDGAEGPAPAAEDGAASPMDADTPDTNGVADKDASNGR